MTEYFCGTEPLEEIFSSQLSIEKRIIAEIIKVKNLFKLRSREPSLNLTQKHT
jgi:hypothetical protein